MKTFLKSFLVSMLLCMFIFVPARAQEVTPSPVPSEITQIGDTTTISGDAPVTIIHDDNPVLLAVLVVLVVLAVLEGAVIYELAKRGFEALPPWMKEFVLSNRATIEKDVDVGFDVLETATDVTPNTLDNALVKYGRAWVEDRIKKFFDEEEPAPPALAPPATNEVTVNVNPSS